MGIEARYSRGHFHPQCVCWVEIVTYERDDGRYDVYIFEEEELPAQLERWRADEFHTFFETIDSVSEIDESVERIHTLLGPGWEPVPFMRTRGSRTLIGKVYDHLRAHRRFGGVHAEGESWVLMVRRKDWDLASEVARPNVDI